MQEIWDGYNEQEELLEIDLIRGEEIPEGVFHLAASVIIKHVDGSYLLMQRDFSKSFPGFFEATASGAVLKGETPSIAAIREAKEETGVVIGIPILLNKMIIRRHQLILYFYLAETECAKTSVKLQQGETIAYKWVDRQGFLDFMASDEVYPEQRVAIDNYLKSI